MDETSFGDEAREQILFCPISIRCLPDYLRFDESVLLPIETASHSPRQDSRQLRLKLLQQLLVAFLFRNRDRKRNKFDASPNGKVGPPDRGLVIGRKKNLVSRLELEKVLSHFSGPNPVTAGELLHQGLSHSLTFVSLNRRYQSPPAQVGTLGGVRFV